MTLKPLTTAALIATLAFPGLTNAKSSAKPVETKETSHIEVCFVLVTTGSMGGLIEGAKQKIWSIANDIASAKPTPKLKIGLIGYRDRGDAYITKVTDLTDDIDAVYDVLKKFKAGGGGDGPESVNQALNEAVTKMTWSENKKTLKIIFLVGDAPPHTDYKQDVQYPDTCKLAAKNDLIINTIQCGADRNTTRIWQEIANKAEGSYVAIGQSGDMIAVATPMDKELATASAELASLRVGYGDASIMKAKADKAREMSTAPAPVAASRALFVAKKAEAEAKDYDSTPAGRGRLRKSAMSGRADLLDAIDKKVVVLEDLEQAKLPEEMREMNKAERETFVKERLQKKKQIQAKISKLSRQRDEYVAAERKKLAAEGKGSGFDAQVGKMIRKQAAAKGISY